jgi:Cdc6-like AAA superfamily ATPase
LTTDQKNRLKNIAMSIQAIQLIHRRFSTFFSKREEISELSKMTQNSLFGKSFLQISGNYIAKSMDNKLLKSDGVFESFKYFNIIKKEFELLDGSVIKQDDIATGLASGNYLKQRISNLEGKYLVILLDEIGNMDKKILQEVIESIKKIENEGRLVLALLAKPGNEGITINSY